MTDTTQLDTTPLIEWSHPNEVEAARKLAAQDKPRTDDEEIKIARGLLHGDYKGHRAAMRKKHNITEGTGDDLTPEQIDENVVAHDTAEFSEAVIIQPVEDLNGIFEVVQGNDTLTVGDTIDEAQIEALKDGGALFITQSINEADYHVHAEVSPKGIPLTKQHRIKVSAKSPAEAKKKAHEYTKERNWKIHNIQKVTLAEESGDLEEGFEEGELEDQTSNELRTFSEITAPERLEEMKNVPTHKLQALVKRGETDEEGMSPAFGMQIKAARKELARRNRKKVTARH